MTEEEGQGARETGRKDPEADLEGPTVLQTHSTRERGAHGEGKDWANGGQENQERHQVNQRWSQKSQVTEAERPTLRERSQQVQAGMKIPRHSWQK